MVVLALCEPEVPVTVSVEVPTAAVLLAASVNALYPVVGLGAHEPVTPAGKPDTARFTVPVKPFSGFTLIFAMPLLPCPILPPAFAFRVNVGTTTVSVMVVVDTSDPQVPVIVNVAGPTATLLPAASASVLYPSVGFGLHEADTPLGSPVTPNATLPMNPY
jgi:hypothetical protein